MSENSIDVDVNFHLNDINKLFEKIMEGADTDIFKGLSDIGDLDEEGMASLLKDVSLTENKTKLLESFANLGVNSNIINDIYKMVEEMDADQEEDSTIIERTQNSMITLLTLSKTMLKLFEDKFPITTNMQKELDIMNDTLSNQNLDLDDKLDVLVRSVSNIFAPFKEQRAFKVTPSEPAPTFLQAMDKDVARGQIDVMIDFARQVTKKYQELIKKMDEGQAQFRHAGEFDEFMNIVNIGADVNDILEKYKAIVEEEQYKQGLIPSDKLFMESSISTEVRDTMAQVEETMNNIMELFTGIGVQIDTHLLNLETDIRDVVDANEERLLELQATIELLNVATGGMTELKEHLKTVISRGLIDIKNLLEVEFFEKTLVELVHKLIEEKLLQPINTTATAKKLEYVLRLAEASLNTLNNDLERLIKGKTPEQLQDMGLSDVSAVKGMINLSRKKQAKIQSNLDVVMPEFDNEDFMGFNLDYVQGMIETISTRTKEQDKFMVKINDSLHGLKITVDQTKKLAGETKGISEMFDDKLKLIRGGMVQASGELTKTKNQTLDAVNKLNEIIERFTRDNPGQDIDPL